MGAVLKHNYGNFRRATPFIMIVVVLALAGSVFVVWYLIETRAEPRGFEAQCKAKCGSMPYRIERVLLNPFLGETQRRNVREARCVCGSAP